jgi:hypothetical protein
MSSIQLVVSNMQVSRRIRHAVLLHIVVAVIIAWVLWPGHGTAVTPGMAAPDIAAEHWINSMPLTIAGLRGRVVLVEFWTYG